MMNDSSQDLQRNRDLIFVLAGRENRKQYGLELFRQGFSPRVLFSVARFEIRRFSKLPLPVPLDLLKLASPVPPPQRHFFVLFEGKRVQVEHVRPRRFGTLTEIESLLRWLEGHSEIRSLLIVSSSAHLRRVRMCCESLLGPSFNITLLAAPYASDGRRNSESTAAVLLELLKALLYWIILRLRRDHRRPSRKRRRTETQG
jgi:hypothetical protein